ncbi:MULTISPECIES: hypothetical protein [Pseudomonas]|uniref:hypothetical protein n=1 Tax=Pseudomonas TaxID=286 RepID=UPI001AE91509|nr:MULTISPECIES: hypothetical protein [unclassified Pseudomonas]MBP1126466.1 uncharacterized protein (UPF0335 family) [Pseudomonas sp. PvP025]MDQ0400326.1 uncharacterized protein (UPF0335 family) [Pseudomonas sp. PvP006]
MNFVLLQETAIAFTNMVNTDLGRTAIHPVTLEVPEPPPDELHFNRLVVWCYGFFYEAALDVLKECKGLLKTRAPEQTNLYERSARIVQNLRTYKVHNLPPSRENLKKQQTAQDWITTASAKSQGIEGATQELCEITLAMLSVLDTAWKESTKDPEDRNQLVERIVSSLENVWQPYQLDEIVTSVAEEIKLKGFDAKAFRGIHLEAWKSKARWFVDRDAAAVGLRRIIRRAMEDSFGVTG